MQVDMVADMVVDIVADVLQFWVEPTNDSQTSSSHNQSSLGSCSHSVNAKQKINVAISK